MPTQTIFVIQSFPVGHTVWPNETGQNIPRNLTQAQVTTTSTTAVPAGATANITLWLTYDNGANWSPAANMSVTSGAPNASTAPVPFEGATQYKVAVDVTGAPVTLGAQVTTT